MYTYIPFPLAFPFHSGHHRALRRVLCAIHYVEPNIDHYPPPSKKKKKTGMGKVSDLNYVYSYFHAIPQPFEELFKFSNKDPWLITRQNLGHLYIILAFVFYFFYCYLSL